MKNTYFAGLIDCMKRARDDRFLDLEAVVGDNDEEDEGDEEDNGGASPGIPD